MRKLKVRILALSLLLISILTISTLHIYGEVTKVEKISSNYKDKLIRFHVLANSDSEEDQNLKLKVRDEIVKYLQPLLKDSKSIEESEKIILRENENIKKLSKNIIKENGYNYDVKVNLEYSNFPAKQYSNIVLPAGEYKSIRVIIGSGEGKNWWCVMFPPLCFVDENNGVIDKKTDEKLKDILTEEEYKLISGENSKKASNRKMKFKILEILETIKKDLK
ncbi:stage II sporulation protein R [Paraclostridium sordellii]|uniref:stage II sporulation protein R n=1 Tax=Paraclostridium sordellii TaxID=1505 RepID=UPI0030D05F6A